MNRNFYLTPCFPASFTLLIIVFMVFFFPPYIYSYFMREFDFIYGDIKTFFFVLFCLFAFCIGFKLGNFKSNISFNMSLFLIDPLVFLDIMLFIGYILLVIYLFSFNYFIFIRFHLNFLEILLVYGYQYLKYQPSFIPFGLGAIPTFLGFYSFFIFYMFCYLKYRLHIKYSNFKIYLFIILVFIINLLTVNRNILVIIFFGLFLIYNYHYYYNKKIQIVKFFKLILFLIVIFVVTLVLRFSSLNNMRFIGENLIGYTVASYNRLALIVSHNAELKDVNPSLIDLVLPNRIPLFHIYIKQPLTMLEYLDHWHSILKEYNLNYWFNLKTIFGDVYNRIGIFSFLFFFVYGILGGRLYQSFKKGKIIGILFYPTYFASIFIWSLTNIFVSNLFQNIYAFLFIFVFHLIIAPNFEKYKKYKFLQKRY